MTRSSLFVVVLASVALIGLLIFSFCKPDEKMVKMDPEQEEVEGFVGITLVDPPTPREPEFEQPTTMSGVESAPKMIFIHDVDARKMFFTMGDTF